MKKLLLILFSLPLIGYTQVRENYYDTTHYEVKPIYYNTYYPQPDYLGCMIFGTSVVTTYTIYRAWYYNDPIFYYQIIPPLSIDYILIRQLIEKKRNPK